MVSKQETAVGRTQNRFAAGHGTAALQNAGPRTAALQKAAPARTLGTGVQTPNQRKAANALPNAWDTYPMGIYAWLLKDAPADENYATLVTDGVVTIDEFMMHQVASKKGTTWEYTPIKYWPHSNQYQLKFFAYHPIIDTVNSQGAYLTLDVANKIPKMTYNVPTTIAHQVDLLSAIPSGTNVQDMFSGTYNQTVNFPFKHMLSAVKIKLGSIATKGVVNKFGFSGIYNEGVGVMGDKFALTTTAVPTAYMQDSTNKPIEIATRTNTQIGNTQLLMPQTFKSDSSQVIKLQLGFTRGETTNTYDLSVPLLRFTKEWLPGKTYTYTLTTPEEVSLAVTDKVIGAVKQDLKIQNTGLATAYIRAALVGHWIVWHDGKSTAEQTQDAIDNHKYDIVASWINKGGETDDGVLILNTQQDKNGNPYWIKGSDGYYYYRYPVKPGAFVSAPFFDTYTLTSYGPYDSAELELTVLGHAVHIADVRGGLTNWPTDIISQLATSTEEP